MMNAAAKAATGMAMAATRANRPIVRFFSDFAALRSLRVVPVVALPRAAPLDSPRRPASARRVSRRAAFLPLRPLAARWLSSAARRSALAGSTKDGSGSNAASEV